jgi:hypothetical protein
MIDQQGTSMMTMMMMMSAMMEKMHQPPPLRTIKGTNVEEIGLL